uniref:Ig-like domain-containing protein n=1 Tax=Podarcis muralis TaxID=64176 RepID=A0A670K3Y5_PODMU
MHCLICFLFIDQNTAQPNISLIPGYIAQLGSKVTIQCSAQGQSKRFYLHKAEDKRNLQIAVTNEDRKNFSINKMNWEHGGSFYCSYTEPSQFFTSSEASDRVELFVLDPNLYIPTISMSPSNLVAFGEQVTIRCETGKEAMMFYLHKDGDPSLNWTMETELYHGTLSIHNVSWDNKGSYSCSYVAEKRPKALSLQSDPTELLISGKVSDLLPIPVMSIYPSSFVSLGHSVTIQCKTEERSAKFFLHKAGDPKPRFLTSPKSNEGELSLNISWEDKGSYRCSYIPQSNLFLHSRHSSPLQLPATGVLSHDEEVTLGSNVTIDCRSNGTAVRFYFQKYGVAKPVQLIQKNGTVAKFSISNASWEHSGYYSCTYSALPDCFAISEPSDEVELQLTGKKNLVLHASASQPKVPFIFGWFLF